MNFLITGDTHRVFTRFDSIKAMPSDTAIIILGDVGLNYTLDKNDYDTKAALCRKYPFTFYCVRGNHEARPEDVPTMELVYDEEVDGLVWQEPDFPRIKYFTNWGVYTIDGLRTLVIGGAYSIDKYWRLQNGQKWFANEQLNQEERNACWLKATQLKQFDMVLAHTCPLSLQPTDLFLRGVDQSLVDSSMEEWMEQLFRTIKWKIFMFGHYHADRIEWPHVEQFYTEIEPLQDILYRWNCYDETGELDWWLPLSPRMKRIVEED